MFDPSNRMQQKLTESLFTDEARHVYVLLDPMHVDPSEELQFEKSECESFVIPLGREDIPEDRYPRLIHIHPHAVEVVHGSLALALAEQSDPGTEQDNGFSIGGWLITNAAPDVLVRHFSACMRQMASGSSAIKYVRWADRRVFEWMWEDIDKDSRAKLLGPIISWWAIDRCGKLVERNVDIPTYRSFPMVRFHMHAAHWTRAALCEPVQAVLRGWRRFADPLPQDYLAQAAQASRGASSLGLTEMEDIVLVSAYVLQVHPRLYEHPRLRELIRKSLEQSLPLMDVLAEVPDPDGWNAMRDELDRINEVGNNLYRSGKHG